MLPAVTYSTRLYVFPTGVPLLKWSVTDVMMLLEPSQKNVAIIASPRCGLTSLNPLRRCVPLSPNAPLF